jgi:hypothetical protein
MRTVSDKAAIAIGTSALQRLSRQAYEVNVLKSFLNPQQRKQLQS